MASTQLRQQSHSQHQNERGFGYKREELRFYRDVLPCAPEHPVAPRGDAHLFVVVTKNGYKKRDESEGWGGGEKGQGNGGEGYEA